MNRRELLKAGVAGSVASAFGGYFVRGAEQKPLRVGLIGTGWYGKSDLFRLIQVAPVEVVSLCDVDKRLLAEAADLVAARQASKKKPRTYGDYREMLKEKDLDVVLIGTPDHWHALTMIAAVEAGAHVYVQKPISVDIAEGVAMVAAARKHQRVVQVGTQRKSTPHLIDCKKNVVEAGLLGKVGHVEACCYFHMRANDNSPPQPVPEYLDYEMWTGPAPLRPYDGIPHRRWWRAFMEYGNGIVGDMCIHMLDTARWMLGLGWPKRVSSAGGILVQKGSKSNISDTQTATFEYDDLNVVWTHRTWGHAPDPKYPWALFIYGDKGTLKASTMSYDFYPAGKDEPSIHKDVVYEREQYPEDLTEKDIELNAAPATRLHMKDFLNAIATQGKPVADIEEGHTSTASCILANIAMKVGRTLVWDAAKGQVVGDDEANRLLKRAYRAPWVHPADKT
ncbi:MAG: Gfo/Idh/MocA family protein [Phycisphaerae bacterium]